MNKKAYRIGLIFALTLALLISAAGCGADAGKESSAEAQASTEAQTSSEAPSEKPESAETPESQDTPPEQSAEPEASEPGSEEQEPTAPEEPLTDKTQVAGTEDLKASESIDDEGLVPVTGDMLRDGKYEIAVDSSSSMFRVDACELTVAGGEMTAAMTMSGTGYLCLFMGTGADAAKSPESAFIQYEETDGVHTFTVPVEALNRAIPCAAYSKRKEMWYDRTLIFRADQLPLGAYAEGVAATAESLGLADGNYTAEVTLSGGSGKTAVESPAELTVLNGEATVRVVWGSGNYDYMVVDGVRYDPVNTDGNSAFEIPALCFDLPFGIIVDSTAMGMNTELRYSLLIDSSTVAPVI